MTESSLTDLASCACFNLRRAARQLSQVFDATLRPSGVSGGQFSLLAVLRAAKGRSVRLSDLASRLGLDRTTLTRNLHLAEREGWVSVVRSDQDRRERLVTLTEAGAAAFERALPYWREAQAQAVRQLGAGGLEQLLDLTGRLRSDPA